MLIKVLFSIFIVLGLFFGSQIDDDLSDDSLALLERLDGDSESTAYFYLMGIFANENEDPIEVGRVLVKEYQAYEKDDSYKVVEYPRENKLPLPDGELFCHIWKKGCLERLFDSDTEIEALLNDHATLLTRIGKFHSFDEYRTLTKPTVSEVYPEYMYIVQAERLRTLEAISAYNKGKYEIAISALLNQYMQVKNSLTLQDNLIGKMILLMKLSEIVDVLSVVSSSSKMRVEEIRGLRTDERSFRLVAAREFGILYYGFQEMDRNTNFFHDDLKFPGWLVRAVYKPNMTINVITPEYYRMESLSILSPYEFAIEVDEGEKLSMSTSQLRNYFGGKLISINLNFDEYIARFMDFEAKIELFNHLHTGFDQAKNPYYNSGRPEVSADRACFDGPLKDDRFLRCLRIAIPLVETNTDCSSSVH
ncbi:hypothetical protein [Teredinibacter sp. KSP-S5-2]|uniref:hypothetical protein n=1 Tax=Teredinibacter sp. KSP-S5-2 TaxID=3034506 RepID=UPI00293439B1|nr:hypothetical protein [Teredinibacter sp. KSP-S5-2]WNO10735.1 hypothetical protein P5V12_06055 [Teredinibacter sp. KSP-S5-2]